MASGAKLSWSGATLNAGTSTIRLRLLDQAGHDGNTASRGYTLATTPPPVPTDFDIAAATDTGANDRTTAHNLPIIGFTSAAGLTISLAGPAGGVLTPGGTGHYQLAATGARYTVTLLDTKLAQAGRQPFGTYASGKATGNATDLADGIYTLTGTDLAGNQSTLGSFAIDTTAPAAPTDLDISAATDTGTNDLHTWNGRPVLTFTAESGQSVVLTRNAAGRISRISGTGEPGLRVDLRDGTATIGSATVGVTGKWSFLPSTALASAPAVVASQTDYAGNVGVAVAGTGATYIVPTARNVSLRNVGTNTVIRLDAGSADVSLDLGSDPSWRLDLIGVGGTFANAAAVRSALVSEGSGARLALPGGGTVHFTNIAPSSALFDSVHIRLW